MRNEFIGSGKTVVDITDCGTYTKLLCLPTIPPRPSQISSARPRKSAKSALSRIFPRVPYCEAFKLAQIVAIRDRQNHLTKKLFQSVVNDPSNKLHALLPTRCNVGYNLRREKRFAQPIFRTKRFEDPFVNRCVSEEMYS